MMKSLSCPELSSQMKNKRLKFGGQNYEGKNGKIIYLSKKQ